jgi:thioredoxin 1
MGKFAELINGETPVLVDFFAHWCGPCKEMAPQLEDLASKINDKAKIIKVDIDKNPQAANIYKIKSVPTLLLFKKGQILWRQSGVMNSSALEQVIKQYS